MEFRLPAHFLLPVAVCAPDIDDTLFSKFAQDAVNGLRASVFAIDEQCDVYLFLNSHGRISGRCAWSLWLLFRAGSATILPLRLLPMGQRIYPFSVTNNRRRGRRREIAYGDDR